MKKTSIILIIFVFAVFVTNASELHKYQYTNSLGFEKRISIIHSKVVDLTDIFVLHDVKEFNEVYFYPLKFKDSIIEFLKKPASFENQVIAICSMTRLPLDEYVQILNSYFVLYRQNRIKEQLLERCIFNEFDTDNRVAKQYKNPSVRRLLTKMLTCKTLSKNFKINVKETLSGKWYNDLKVMRDI